MKDSDFSFFAVPATERKGFWTILAVMSGFTFFSASMWIGANLGTHLTLSDFFTAVITGNIVLGVYTGVLAYIASSTGHSTYLLAADAFGYKGSFLPTFLLALTQIGWFGIGIAMLAIPLKAILWQYMGDINIWWPVIISGMLMTTSAYWGIKSLAAVSILAVPAIVIFGLYSIFKIFSDNPAALSSLITFIPPQGTELSMGTAIAIAIGSFISGGTCTSDFVRFAKTKTIAVTATFIAFFAGSTLMFIFGAFGGMFYHTNDISNVLIAQGLLIPGILVLGFNIWTTNDNALYTSSLGLAHITHIPKKPLVLFNGILGTLAALWINDNFTDYLVILNSFIPPLGAILIANYFFISAKRTKDTSKDIYYFAIIAWIGGVLCSFIPFGINAINGMLAATIILYTLNKIFFKH